MDTYLETFETWNKVASLYEDKFMQLDLYNESYDSICNSITNANAHLLEIGCGPGNITKYILEKRPDCKIYGIDVATNMIELARKNNPKAKFDVMDAREIGEINSIFDGIICGFCVPYLSENDCKKLFSNCRKLTNDNGFLYLSFVEGDAKKSGFKTNSSGDKVYFFYHHIDNIKKNLSSNGFEIIETYKVDYKKSISEIEVHTVLIAIKNITS